MRRLLNGLFSYGPNEAIAIEYVLVCQTIMRMMLAQLGEELQLHAYLFCETIAFAAIVQKFTSLIHQHLVHSSEHIRHKLSEQVDLNQNFCDC
jgi:hypothetical protein